MDFFQRSGVLCWNLGGSLSNIADASIKLGESNALSCRARERIVETAQKMSFLVGEK